MAYFKNFPNVNYKFGEENYSVSTPDLSAYTDIVDTIKDQISFYQLYTIQNERPDQLSYKLYENPSYYWTFFLMNDAIRRQGWPLGQREAEEAAQKVFNKTTITTRNHINGSFPIGGTVTGVTSEETGTIVRRNLDLGQIIINGTKNFTNNEVLKCNTTDENIIVFSSSEEYNSAKEYVDGDRNVVDIVPEDGPGVLLTAVTYMDYYKAENEKLREIKVIKPEAMSSVISAFNQAIRST